MKEMWLCNENLEMTNWDRREMSLSALQWPTLGAKEKRRIKVVRGEKRKRGPEKRERREMKRG